MPNLYNFSIGIAREPQYLSRAYSGFVNAVFLKRETEETRVPFRRLTQGCAYLILMIVVVMNTQLRVVMVVVIVLLLTKMMMDVLYSLPLQHHPQHSHLPHPPIYPHKPVAGLIQPFSPTFYPKYMPAVAVGVYPVWGQTASPDEQRSFRFDFVVLLRGPRWSQIVGGRSGGGGGRCSSDG